jgi:hypothetical protein
MENFLDILAVFVIPLFVMLVYGAIYLYRQRKLKTMSGGMSDEQLKGRIAWLEYILSNPGDKYSQEQIDEMKKELEVLKSYGK